MSPVAAVSWGWDISACTTVSSPATASQAAAAHCDRYWARLIARQPSGRTTAGQASVDDAVCGDISRSNSTGPVPNDTFQVMARASGEDGSLKK